MSLLFTLIMPLAAADRAVLVHNSLQDINACQGKLKLKPLRVWGGDKEGDENKFFNTPISVAVDKNNLLYICDMHNNCIKVFESVSGKYFRTFGRFGKGPMDIYAPISITLSPGGELWVAETLGFRIQLFSPEGKSKKIIKTNKMPMWIGNNSKDELAIYYYDRTINTGKIISIFNNEGKIIRDIGTYHDKSKSITDSEKLTFAIDNSDNIYASYTATPVIRKYSPDGVLLMAITFEYPFETEPVDITLNDRADEINIVKENGISSQIQKNKRGVTIQEVMKKGKPRVGSYVMVADSQKQLYAMTLKRYPSEKEMFATAISGGFHQINRSRVDYNIVENIDIYRLLVFGPEGKVIAEAQLKGYCDAMYISGNRLFIVDGYLNQRVLEYEMSFEQ